ncbi:competence protein ComK [Sporosarcina sp.]|uniref:competence protein ComK n=1 Tax=Sporosarcina sp. TaxID=49982 RepID=UPI00260B467A|nr:competence protein ComK [Sporosarcina sp.]
MKISKEFIVTKGTAVIYPEYTEEGVLQSVAMEGNVLKRVNQKPTEVIDRNLRYYGSSLRGAKDSTKVILGDVFMSPVVINELLNIFFFPSKSPHKPDCIWFALYHIRSYIEIDAKRTCVTFINGAKFKVDVSYYSFNSRYQTACKYKNLIDGRTNQLMINEMNHSATYLIMKDRSNRNFGVKEEE